MFLGVQKILARTCNSLLSWEFHQDAGVAFQPRRLFFLTTTTHVQDNSWTSKQ